MSRYQDDTMLTKGKDKSVKLFYIQRENVLIIADAFVPPVKLIKSRYICTLQQATPSSGGLPI